MASHDVLFDGYSNYSDYDDYDEYFFEFFAEFFDNYNGFRPRKIDENLEAKIEQCVDDFETGQAASCGINQRELKQAMLDTQAGLLKWLKLRIVVSLKLP